MISTSDLRKPDDAMQLPSRTKVIPNPAASHQTAHRRQVTIRAIQVILGAAWFFDGLLQLQPHMFTSAFVTNVLEPSAQSQPGIIAWMVSANVHLLSTERVNLFEADFLMNHCAVAITSSGSAGDPTSCNGTSSGLLIQTAPGRSGGAGALRTKRSGWAA